MVLLKTSDGGAKWENISDNNAISLFAGEASFAASGTNIRCDSKGNAWIATGGIKSRIFHSNDYGTSWTAHDCPIVQEFNKNEDANKQLSYEVKNRLKKIYAGGGEKAAAKQKEKGKMLARERISYLIDKDSRWLEIGAFAAEDMYQDVGGCPSAGVICGIGYVSGRQCMIIANDATVKAGAWFPITAKKNLRAQEIAMENRLPVIYLVDSAGVFLPYQDEIFPDKEHFGRIFRNNAIMTGGAYLPIMSDEAMIVEGTGSVFLAGSYLVKSAIGEDIDNETLGGASTHYSIKKIMSMIGAPLNAGFDRIKPASPKLDEQEIYGILPNNRESPYDMRILFSYKQLYGQSIICGLGRIDGWAVGIVANQPSRFIMNCNQKKIPLVFLQDVTGFMVGSRSEQGGIIKDGAKMVNVVANSVVPKFTIVIGNSYGAGNYAMCGKAYDPRLIYAWPSAKIAVMGGSQAAKVLLQIQEASLKAKGEVISKEKEDELLKDITNRYDSQTTPYYAASRLWVDGIIDPLETRKVISMGIEAANQSPIESAFNPGVLQT
ncbi:hypothetical protein GHT06_006835 [Daphnia sinensis]|uniref:methylcrotonoyl-CoA carboxylase n=1 Tax=Daphnia sinensis TaxID=1820382 RepID=A0AAD5PQB2_9CRUS|nr:hypothetical protein GHT06_006835 [Daphnia sinensis]